MRNCSAIALVILQITACYVGVSSDARSQTIENKDVYMIANQLADEVELIREVMGRPYDDSPRLPVAGITTFELFFQAQTLFYKSNQLAHEISGVDQMAASAAPYGEIDAADIHEVVSDALEQIRLVKDTLRIDEESLVARRETPMPTTGVFSVILDASRQLNVLLSKPISPADVFEQVTFAVIDLAGILASQIGDTSTPLSTFEGHKRSADVYRRLLECIDIVAEVAPRVGIGVLSLSSRRNVPDNVEPGHAYDIAKILVADIALLADALEAQEVYPDLGDTPEHIFPSQVFERAGMLKAQLETLEASL